MLKRVLTLFCSIILLASVACAEDPEAAVKPITSNDDGGEGASSEEPEELKALIYSGKVLRFDPNGNGGQGGYVATNKPCTIQFSMIEEGGEHLFVAQLLEKIHGEKAPAMELGQHYLQASDGQYVKTRPENGDFEPTLVAIELDDKDEEVDVNKLDEYDEEGHLAQSMELFFNQDTDFEEFEEELESILESTDTDLSSANMDVLNQLYRTTIKVEHIGHVDTLVCNGPDADGNGQLDGFSLASKTEKVEFELEHEGHDHDHGHDH